MSTNPTPETALADLLAGLRDLAADPAATGVRDLLAKHDPAPAPVHGPDQVAIVTLALPVWADCADAARAAYATPTPAQYAEAAWAEIDRWTSDPSGIPPMLTVSMPNDGGRYDVDLSEETTTPVEAGLPTITYAADATDSWQALLDSMGPKPSVGLDGWHATLTLDDGTTREVLIQGSCNRASDGWAGLAYRDADPATYGPVGPVREVYDFTDLRIH